MGARIYVNEFEDKIKFTNNSTTFYGFVTAIASGTMTLYGGTDYDVANSAITNAYFSHNRSPVGFTQNPDKWTILTTDTGDRQQGTPTTGTWYNVGSVSQAIHIGAWNVSYRVMAYVVLSVSGAVEGNTSLSTSSSSQSDLHFSSRFYTNASATNFTFTTQGHKPILLTSKTTYYLISKTTGSNLSILGNAGSAATTVIRSVCAYL